MEKRTLPPPAASTVYVLTDAGRKLETSLVALARWGARFGRAPSEDDALGPGCLALGLRWMFRPEAARHVRATYEVRVEGEVVSAAVNRGEIEVSAGPAENPDLVIEVLDRAVGHAMIEGRMPAHDARMSEHLRFDGDPKALEDFLSIFAIDPVPAVAAGA